MHQAPKAKLMRPAPADLSINPHRDPNTLSNYQTFLTKHTAVDLQVDFGRKLLHGNVTLTLESCTQAGSSELVLDTRYGFSISSSSLSCRYRQP